MNHPTRTGDAERELMVMVNGMGLELAFFASPIARRAEVEAGEAWVRREVGELPAETGAAAKEPAARGKAGATGEKVPVAVVLTGGTEDQVLAWLATRAGPALLLALPHSNSLPASLEILARLRQEGRGGRIVLAGRGGWRRELARVSRLAALAGFMRQARIGLLGGPSSWLAASSPDPETVRQVWGPEVVTIPLEEVVTRFKALDEARRSRGDGAKAGPAEATRRPDDLAAGLREAAAGIVEPDEATVAGAVGLYRVLKAIAAEHELDALTIRCFDLLGDLENTGCFALSRLNDEGLTAACEGDLPAALTMMILGGLSGRACFMANPSDMDPAEGTVTFAHCSVPLGLVKTYRLRSHFESGLGVGLEGHFEPGKMTVARIGGEGLREVEAFTGTIVPAASRPFREDLCRTQVTLKVGETAVRKLLERPLGNHHVLVPGDHEREFYDFYTMNSEWRLSALDCRRARGASHEA